MPRSVRALLNDILEAISGIQSTLADVTFEAFTASWHDSGRSNAGWRLCRSEPIDSRRDEGNRAGHSLARHRGNWQFASTRISACRTAHRMEYRQSLSPGVGGGGP